MLWQGRLGKVSLVGAGYGEVRHGTAGELWLVWVRLGAVRQGRRGRASLGEFGQGKARCGRHGESWFVLARSCKAWQAWSLNILTEVDYMSAYAWKTASYIKANADVAGKMCEELEKDGGLTPERLLEANKEESAPLHNEFEWKDTIAAHKYRIEQARHIIQCLITIPEGQSEEAKPVRAFVVTGQIAKYEHINAVLKSEDKYELMLEQALRELKSFQQKYSTLKELTPLFETINAISA